MAPKLPSGTEGKGGSIFTYCEHNFFQIVPPDAYFKDHPEWFALINGKRCRIGQLCLSNPQVRQRFIDYAKWSFGNDSGAESRKSISD